MDIIKHHQFSYGKAALKRILFFFQDCKVRLFVRTWGWVKDDRVYISGWTISLISNRTEISTELKTFQQPSLFCVFNYPGSTCVALESDGERTTEGISTLLVYSRGGCVGIEVCEIPVVELRKWFPDKNRAWSRPDPFYRQYALEKPSWAEREGEKENTRKIWGVGGADTVVRFLTEIVMGLLPWSAIIQTTQASI